MRHKQRNLKENLLIVEEIFEFDGPDSSKFSEIIFLLREIVLNDDFHQDNHDKNASLCKDQKIDEVKPEEINQVENGGKTHKRISY